MRDCLSLVFVSTWIFDFVQNDRVFIENFATTIGHFDRLNDKSLLCSFLVDVLSTSLHDVNNYNKGTCSLGLGTVVSKER